MTYVLSFSLNRTTRGIANTSRRNLANRVGTTDHVAYVPRYLYAFSCLSTLCLTFPAISRGVIHCGYVFGRNHSNRIGKLGVAWYVLMTSRPFRCSFSRLIPCRFSAVWFSIAQNSLTSTIPTELANLSNISKYSSPSEACFESILLLTMSLVFRSFRAVAKLFDRNHADVFGIASESLGSFF